MSTQDTPVPLSWEELEALCNYKSDSINGPTNAHSTLRLFAESESNVRVTLYRDHHAWCPYCQKIWIYLEEKQIPYKISKVTMFCYGEKERWYLKKVRSGMLPALEIDGRIITESDDILFALEETFGSLEYGMSDKQVIPLRKLERKLFGAWCNWLCYPHSTIHQDNQARTRFEIVAQEMNNALGKTAGPFMLEKFSTADIVFIPYLERMNASLFYYKGFNLRDPVKYANIATWFDAIERRETYRGTQSDFHTHVHDLPPQMGGCFSNDQPDAIKNQALVDNGPWAGIPDVGFQAAPNVEHEALYRVLRHRTNIIKVNPADKSLFDPALRSALTTMMTGKTCTAPKNSDSGLRYLRDRVNVPRDMSIHAAKRLRDALESTAATAGHAQGKPITTNHRRDQDPRNFVDIKST